MPETGYYNRSGVKRGRGNVVRRDTAPLPEPPTKRDPRERTVAECSDLPVPVELAGYDRARVTTYDWWKR